jgi:hypothetical protein
MKTHTLAPNEGLQSADSGSEAISGLWDKHQPLPLIWAENPLRHEACIHDKNPHESVTPETWMGVLLCCSPVGATATLVLKVVPSGMPHRGRDVSLRDMHLVAVAVEVVGSERSEPLAEVSWGPLHCFVLVCWATNASYTSPPLLGLSFCLLSAASLPVEP